MVVGVVETWMCVKSNPAMEPKMRMRYILRVEDINISLVSHETRSINKNEYARRGERLATAANTRAGLERGHHPPDGKVTNEQHLKVGRLKKTA